MELHYQILHELEENFKTYYDEFDQVRERVYSKVTMWKWATASQACLELVSLERNRRPKGRWLKGKPQNRAEYVKVGVDEAGKILVEEEFQSHPAWGHDRIYLHEQDYILALEYNKQKELLSLEKAILVAGKQEWYGSISDKNRANSVDRYYYNQGRVTNIATLWLYDQYIQTPIYYITYHLFGGVESVRRVDPISGQFPKGQGIYVYRKKSISDKELIEVLIRETTKQIIETLQQLNEQEPCYCLMLVLFDAFGRDNWFPPAIAIGLESERKQWDKDADQQWNPQLFKYGSIEIKGELLYEYSQLFMQECELKKKYNLPGKVLKQIAKALKRQGLGQVLKLTNHFIIVPFDYDQPSIIKNLKGVYTQREINQLMLKGLTLN